MIKDNTIEITFINDLDVGISFISVNRDKLNRLYKIPRKQIVKVLNYRTDIARLKYKLNIVLNEICKKYCSPTDEIKWYSVDKNRKYEAPQRIRETEGGEQAWVIDNGLLCSSNFFN